MKNIFDSIKEFNPILTLVTTIAFVFIYLAIWTSPVASYGKFLSTGIATFIAAVLIGMSLWNIR